MIKDVRLGNDLEQPCLVRLQKVGTSSNGKAYARGLLEDNSGTLPFICFEAGPINRLRTMEGPTPFIIGGRVDANKYASPMGGQNLQVIVQKVVPPDGETDLSMLLPTGPIDLESLEVEFQTLIGRIQDEPLQRLVKQVFSGKRYERFLRNPAGMRLHHAYVGVCCIIRFVWPAWLLAWARPSVGWTLISSLLEPFCTISVSFGKFPPALASLIRRKAGSWAIFPWGPC